MITGAETGEGQFTVFTPDTEPYRGRQLLFHLDQMILVLLEQNGRVLRATYGKRISIVQIMARQNISQAISLALSIRELIRQGYLFGAHVLKRTLIERQMILLYLFYFPEEASKWSKGWHHPDAPSLSFMIDAIQERQLREAPFLGRHITSAMNGLVHGKPESAFWSSVFPEGNEAVHTVSKTLNRPDLCDDVCADIIPSLGIVHAMMAAYFPETGARKQD